MPTNRQRIRTAIENRPIFAGTCHGGRKPHWHVAAPRRVSLGGRAFCQLGRSAACDSETLLARRRAGRRSHAAAVHLGAGREAKRRLQHFFSWDPDGPTNFFAYDEPPMWMMMRGTRAYDWTCDLFASAEREKIEANRKARAGQFLKHLQRLPFESSPYDSHAGRLPGFLGECALSFIHEWPEAREWLQYATLLVYTSYPAWGGDDGGWQEGPGYWGAHMQFAQHYVTVLRQAAGVDLMQKPFFRNTPYYGLYTATPYHQHSPFGDGQTGSPRGLGHVMYVFSTLAQEYPVPSLVEVGDVKFPVLTLSIAWPRDACQTDGGTAATEGHVVPRPGVWP